MKTLETDRLLLRAWSIDDTEDFFEYAKNPNVGPNAGWEPHSDKEFTLKIIMAFIENGAVWAIVYKENGKVIGSLGLHTDKRREDVNAKMIGYVLSQEYWGRGLMTEAVNAAIQYAFEEMKLGLLSVCHYPFNTRSQKVIEKCGFQYEGTLRLASTRYDGAVLDDVCYSMTSEEYAAFNKIK